MTTRQEINAFFRNRGNALQSATAAALKRSGTRMSLEANRQLKRNFKNRAGRAKSRFFKARGPLPDATIVSIKPSFLQVFEKGATIKGDRYLVMPLNTFPRVGKRGFEAKLQELKARGGLKSIPTQTGFLIVSQGTPAYALTRRAEIPEKLNIRAASEKIGASIPKNIESLLKREL